MNERSLNDFKFWFNYNRKWKHFFEFKEDLYCTNFEHAKCIGDSFKQINQILYLMRYL